MKKRDDIITEARERYEYASEAWGPIFARMRDDLRFSDPTNPQQWPEDAKRDREKDKRPCLTFDQTGQYVRQVVNQARRNKPAMKFMPVDDQSDPKTAEVLQGLARQVEYESRAEVAYITALNHAVRGGLGFFRAITEEVKDGPVVGQLCIKVLRVIDPEAVIVDPDFVQSDGSDARYGFVTEMMPRATFRKRYPSAAEVDWEGGDQWADKDHVRVCEYFRLVDGKCEWHKITGEEVLESTEFPAPFVPIFPVLGNEEWDGTERRLSGAIRAARDAQITYNFERNSEFEAVAVGPKAPWLAPVEAVSGHEGKWAQANRGNLAYLPYNSIDEQGNPVQKPERISPAGVAAGWTTLSERSRADIQSAMGMFEASVGNNPNQQSGRAVLALQDKADVGSFHYIDNLALSIAHLGRVLTSVWPKIYDQAQIVRIIGEDDKPNFVQVDPSMPGGYAEMPLPNGEKQIVINPNVGRYDVRVTVGPAYASRQAEAAAEIGEMVNGNPQLMAILGDVWVKMRNFPEADKVANRLRALLPPEVKAAEDDDAPQQIPPQVEQAMQQAAQRIQQLEQALQESQSGMQAKQLEASVRLQIATMAEETKRYVSDTSNDTKQDIEQLKGLLQLVLAQMRPPPMLAAEVAEDLNEGTEQVSSSFPQ